MSQKTIKPVAGRRVRQPDGTLIPETGKAVVWNAFWARRLRDGDITVMDEATTKAKQEN